MSDDLLARLWPTFAAEARESLEALGSGLLELEQFADAERLRSLRRVAHNLKGAAASLGLSDIERLAHALEDGLDLVEPHRGPPAAGLQPMLDAVAALERAIALGEEGQPATVAGLDVLVEALSPGNSGNTPGAAAVAATGPGALPTVSDPVEAYVAALCSPGTPVEELARAAAAAARHIEPMPAEAQGGAAAAARALDAALRRKVLPGTEEAARLAAELAGALVAMKRALSVQGPAAAAPRPAPAQAAPDKSIRVSSTRIDELARHLDLLMRVGAQDEARGRELAEAGARLSSALRCLADAAIRLRESGDGITVELVDRGIEGVRKVGGQLAALGRRHVQAASGQRLTMSTLRRDLRDLRMVPAALLLEPLRRAARDVAGRLGKPVELHLEGREVRLDRRIVDELHTPLLHLVRNAIDHGIEAADVRRAAGKPETGSVTVRVQPRGNRVAVLVEDDGAGLDPAGIRRAAVARGLVAADAAVRLSDADIVRLVFRQGLSTAARVNEVSGRGVGLDVVSETVARLRGTIDASSEPGRGARFTIDLPLTLAAVLGIQFRVGREVIALPAESVERVLRVYADELGTVSGESIARIGKDQLPFVSLSVLLGVDATPASDAVRGQPAFVLAVGTQRVVVAVDEILQGRELEVASLGPLATRSRHVAGGAVLEDGRVIAMLNPAELLARARRHGGARASASRPTILVADDSLTTRSAVKALLEIAGYGVAQAEDGRAALEVLRRHRCQVVVTDLQMPHMDGLELTRRIKADPKLKAIPVIVVTSLGSSEDRAAGLAAGADGYLVKREVESGKLLDLVRQLLHEAA